MRVGINLLCVLPGVNGGVETYCVSMLETLVQRHPAHEYIVFVNRHGASLRVLQAPNVTAVVCDFDAYSRSRRYGWEHLVLPRQVRSYRLDVLHSPGYQGPVNCGCPCVVTLPDAGFASIRQMFPLSRRATLGFFCRRSARLASAIITISQFSKSEIVKYLEIPEEKITVTPLACALEPSSIDWHALAQQHRLPERFVVTFAGNNWPHKNLPRLFEALRRLSPRERVSLAVIGALSPDLRALAGHHQVDLRELGFVPREQLAAVLGHARLCVLPSLYEGFGLTVLEAQRAEVPLACSIAASLPEVAGDGARYFDPWSVDDIASAIEHCLADRGYCDVLIRAGRENLMRFSWEKTADQTVAVYERVAGCAAAVQSHAATSVTC